MKIKETIQRAGTSARGWAKRRTKLAIAIGIAVILLLIIVIGKLKPKPVEGIAVTTRDVVEQVRVAGRVEADIAADIGFEQGGIVRSISVKANDSVRKGQRLVALDLGTLPAELASAQAQVAIRRAQMQNAETSLASIKDKQDALVETAYQRLLSDQLEATPESNTYTQRAPLISGRYTGNEGTYKIIIDRRVQDIYAMRTFNLESTGPTDIEKTRPTALGTKGLFISFPDPIADYADTIWYVDIPNARSSSYTSNYNAYQEALRERERALADAEADIRREQSGNSIVQAELMRAQADVARIQALISQRILTAPFSGTVAAVQAKLGESVNSSTGVVSLISDGMLGITVNLPEVDSVKVSVNDPVAITLDAFGDTEVFAGTVASVNRAETLVDGISVYETRIVFDAPDARIASGMTADALIETSRKDGVVAIPARAVMYRKDGTPYVVVKIDEKKTEEREVVLGLRGSDSFFEVRAGLSAGDTVVVTNQ